MAKPAISQFELNAGIGIFKQDNNSPLGNMSVRPNIGAAFNMNCIQFGIDLSYLEFEDWVRTGSSSHYGGSTTGYSVNTSNTQHINHGFLNISYGLRNSFICKPMFKLNLGVYINSSIPIMEEYSVIYTSTSHGSSPSNSSQRHSKLYEANTIHYASGLFGLRFILGKKVATDTDLTGGLTKRLMSSIPEEPFTEYESRYWIVTISQKLVIML